MVLTRDRFKTLDHFFERMMPVLCLFFGIVFHFRIHLACSHPSQVPVGVRSPAELSWEVFSRSLLFQQLTDWLFLPLQGSGWSGPSSSS